MDSKDFQRPSKSHLAFILVGLLLGFIGGATLTKITSAQNGVRQIRSDQATGTVLGLGQLPPAGVSSDVDFKLFWEMWSLMKEKYYTQPIKDKDLFYGAMAGLAGSVGDPYTTFFPPKQAEDFQQSLTGKFEGIGAEIGIKDEQLQIVAPLPDTPAEKAGILAGDLILKIDGTDTAGMSVEKAVSLIRGDKGTKVTLNLFRPDTKKPPFDVTLTRDEIQVKSVRTSTLANGQVSVIEVTHFNGDTEDGFSRAVTEILKKKPKGIILDLRNNPGGFLQTSLSMAGEWIGQQVVVKERRQGKIVAELPGPNDARLKGIPTIVLVNQGSASASEIVAGALQDYGAAQLLGTKTFGKGSVQDYETLSDGSGVKITIAEWLTPKERTINKTGLVPDITIDRTYDDYASKRDPQLDRAVGILTGTATSTPETATSTSR
jgi:carboxyl-terminal processing protease